MEKITNASKQEVRESNIELMRILAMIMIIGHHFAIYGAMAFEKSNVIGITNASNILLQILSYGGSIGNIIFIMITGYFLIDKNFKIEKIIKFWLEVLFYSIIMYLIMCFIGCVEFNTAEFISYCFPISNYKYWFANAYIYLYLFSPFINILLKKLSKKSYIIMLLLWPILFIVPEIVSFFPFYNKSNILSTTFATIYIYSIGSYLKLWKINCIEKMKKSEVVCLTVICLLIIFLIRTYTELLSFKFVSVYILSMDSIFVIAIAICIFNLFLKIDIKNNKIINYIASISFPIYLVHQNPTVVKYLWKTIFYVEGTSIINTITLFITAVLFIYLVTIILETIRRIIIKPLMSSKKMNNIFTKFNNSIKIEEKEN